MATFEIGDQPVVTGLFAYVDGTPGDPSAITIRVRKPDGNIATYDQTNCTNPAVGTWVFQLPSPIDQDGLWTVKFMGTATLIAANTTSWSVECSKVDV